MPPQKPVLWVIEDAHWIDPTTLELIELALDRVQGTRVLVLITARPTFVASFASHPVVTRLALNRLGRAATQAIVARITRGKRLPEPLLDEIAAKTDGVPLFVEEMTKAVIESGVLRESGGRLSPGRPSECAGDPDDAARLADGAARPAAAGERGGADRSGHRPQLRPSHHRRARRAARRASSPMRCASWSMPSWSFAAARRRTPPISSSTHLVRDAAYESLLKAKRITLHARLLDVLEDSGDAAPEVKAQHAEAAGLAERALDYWEQAGTQALARPAYKEAIANLENGVRLCRAVGQELQWKRREQGLHLQIGQALIANQGYQAPATLRAFERAMVLADEIGDVSLQLPAAYGQWVGPLHRRHGFGRARPALCRARRDATRDRAAPRRAAHARSGALS